MGFTYSHTASVTSVASLSRKRSEEVEVRCISGAPATSLNAFGGCETLACSSSRRTAVHTCWKVTQESGASSRTRCKAGDIGGSPSSPDHWVFVRAGSCCRVFFLHVRWNKWQNKRTRSQLIPLCPKKEPHEILINE